VDTQQASHAAQGKSLVSIYKSSRKDEMYLYVAKSSGLKHIPAALLDLFGKPQLVFDLLLTPEKRLARANAGEILSSLQEQGYYLQMPPAPEATPDVVKLSEDMPAKRRPGQNEIQS